MPNATTHSRATFLLIPTVGAVAYYFADTRAAVAACAGVAITLIVNPDLDLLEQSIGAKVRRQWAPKWARWSPLRLLWYLIVLPLLKLFWLAWLPYAFLFRHRSWQSHAPIVSTMIRIGYTLLLLSLPLIPLIVYGVLIPDIPTGLSSRLPPSVWIALFSGWIASDLLHIFMDTMTTGFRRLF